jgi:RNA recognition motif-containing protein
MNILVRNLDRSISEEKIMELFRPFGAVSSVTIVHDQRTGQSKGFGFVDMPDQAEAEAAIKALNLTKILKERIRVKAAIPRSGTGSIAEHIKLQAAAEQTAAKQPASQAVKPASTRVRAPFPSSSEPRPAYKSSFKKPYRTDRRDDSQSRFAARKEARPYSSTAKPYSSTGRPSSARPGSGRATVPEYRPRSERSYGAPGKTGFAPRSERGTGYHVAKDRSERSPRSMDRSAARFPYSDGGKPASVARGPFSRFAKKTDRPYAPAAKSAFSTNRPSSYAGKYDLNKKSSRPFSRFPKRDGNKPASSGFKGKTFVKTQYHK